MTRGLWLKQPLAYICSHLVCLLMQKHITVLLLLLFHVRQFNIFKSNSLFMEKAILLAWVSLVSLKRIRRCVLKVIRIYFTYLLGILIGKVIVFYLRSIYFGSVTHKYLISPCKKAATCPEPVQNKTQAQLKLFRPHMERGGSPHFGHCQFQSPLNIFKRLTHVVHRFSAWSGSALVSARHQYPQIKALK